MDLHFNQSLAVGYHSGSQISRVLTEDWMARNMFCPVCGAPVLGHYEANKPVADFFCDDCKSDFELKSKESKSESDEPLGRIRYREWNGDVFFQSFRQSCRISGR